MVSPVGKHHLREADGDVAQMLVSGLSGIAPDQVTGYVLLVQNGECGVHLTTDSCCTHNALEFAQAVAGSELGRQVPCSGEHP